MPEPTRAARSASRGATIRAVLLVLTGSIGVQISSAFAYGLFDEVGVLGTSGLRLSIAAILLVIIFRPSLRGRSRSAWAGILLYGIAMAAMNILLYLAIDRVPIGVATTIDFLGPCVVALMASRRLREAALALLAFAGVALIAGLGGPFDGLGLMFAALGGAGFGLYTLLAARIGKNDGGLRDMTLSVVIAAILTLPLGVPAIPDVNAEGWVVLVASALLGVALAFVVDTMAGRLTSARVIGVLFAFDPVVGTVVGALWLGQGLTAAALLGIVLVVLAGGGIVWSAGRRRLDAVAEPGAHGATETFEVERKYDVSDRASLPAPAEFRRLGLVLDPAVRHELEGRYFDTAEGALAARRFAMRRRTGGKDAGWHLKERGEDGVRELQWPLSDEPPRGLIEEIERRLGRDFVGLEVIPVATLRTVRTTIAVRDASGDAVVELADDLVDATNRLAGARREWREWEAELAEGADPALLDAIEPLLVAAGARRVLGTSKIQRTMALRAPEPPTVDEHYRLGEEPG